MRLRSGQSLKLFRKVSDAGVVANVGIQTGSGDLVKQVRVIFLACEYETGSSFSPQLSVVAGANQVSTALQDC